MSQDGRSSMPVVYENLNEPKGIFVDETIDRIFWTDSANNLIESANLDGSDRREVVRDSYDPYGIVVFEDRVYWTDFDHFVLRSANKFTGDDIKPEELSYHGRMNSLALHLGHVKSDLQDPCADNPCSHLCLPSGPKDYTCMCPDGMYVGHDGSTCNNLPSSYENKVLVSMGSHIYSLSPQHLGTINLETVGVESDIVVATSAFSVANKAVVATVDGKLAIVHTDWKTSNIIAEGMIMTSLTHDNHNGNIFWIDTADNTIKMMSEVTKRVRKVVHCLEPLAVHYIYSKNLVVYVDADSLLATKPDGQQIHLLASHLPKDVSAVSYSEDEDCYYFSDKYFIYKFKTDQLSYVDLVRVGGRPLSLAVQNQYLYWTEEGSSAVFWADLEEEKFSELDGHLHVFYQELKNPGNFDLHLSVTKVPIDYSMQACSTKYCSDLCMVTEENHAHCLCGDDRLMIFDDSYTSCQDISAALDTKNVPLTSDHITLIAVLCATVLLVSFLFCFGCCYVRRKNLNPMEFINRSFGMSPSKSGAVQEMSPVQTVKTGSLNEVYNPGYYSLSLSSCPPLASSNTPVSAPKFSASFRAEQERDGIIPGIIRSIRKFRDPKMSRIDCGENSTSYESLAGAKGSSTPNSLRRRMETIEEKDSACSLYSGQNSMESDDISVDSDLVQLVNKF
eukprot:TRINITY_DN401_c0_g1_i3.p1 TRINITY_DN401_c0_g1~~TRINITY_DN401_c0_g1_i3.p1  ORF type:complete len:692 (-),score=160.89 TRINITY_DN401_c0_g1_i3:145-2166(-)